LAREVATMAHAARRGVDVLRELDDAAEGVVRIAMPDAVAVDLFPPLLPELHARFPAVRLELLGGNEPVNLERGEADFAIRSVREPRGSVVYRRLPDLPLEVFASPDYLARRVDDDRGHAWITWDAAHEHLPDAQWVRAQLAGRSPVLRASSVPAMRAAAQRGLGCVVLARWHGEAVGLVPVPQVGASLPSMPWYVAYTPATRRVRRVRLVLEHFLEAVKRAELVDRWPPPPRGA
jgi:DNA-binding transcriptional LysR family regulator